MNYLFAAFAGFVQGLTEFLPVSSTGHLIILEKLFGLDPKNFGLSFDASIHLGTLFAVLLFFWKDYLKLLSFKNPQLFNLTLGTIPAVVAGLVFEKVVENNLRSIAVVGTALILFSFVMLAAEKIGKKNKSMKNMSPAKSFLIGVAQAVALIPGISRSGATISMGLFLGMTREESAKFAFLLSGPIIAGAGLKKFQDAITSNAAQTDISLFIVGIVSSSIFGFLTIKYFLKFLSKNSLMPFIVYRLVLGTLLILLTFLS